ncbi:hypothetical protein QOT17_001911 [Balamuthia mandrillaris]
MCGPPNCLVCDRDFFAKLRSDRVTQIWTLIWVPLLILWFIYIGFAFDKLANAEQDRTFQVQLALKEDIPMPAFSVCPRSGVPIIEAETKCHMSLDSKHMDLLLTATMHSDGCIAFNENAKDEYSADFPYGNVTCEITFSNDPKYENNTKDAFALLYDPKLTEKVHKKDATQPDYVPLKEVPSGLCSAEVLEQKTTTLFWKRIIYRWYKGGSSVGYELVDWAAAPSIVPLEKHRARLVLEVGDYFETYYEEVQWYTGYDFWYWLGMVGGFSFLLLMVHSCAFFPFKLLLGGESDTTTSYLSHRDAADSYSTSDVGGASQDSSYGSL